MLIEQIKYFHCVAKCGNFNDAAKECNVSNDIICKEIASLEDELDVKLINIENTNISMTKAGEYFYQKTIKIISDFEQVCNHIKENEDIENNSTTNKIIETDRLILRPFKLGDEEDLLEYLKQINVHCFECMKIDTLEEAKKAIKQREKDKEYYFAIVLKSENKVIGEIDAMPDATNPEEDAPVYDTFSPCWMLNNYYQGKGYAFEAATAFFDYLFNEKGARRIYAYTEDYNVHSQNLCKKLGMRKEGEFKEFVSFVNDEEGNPIYENTLEYSILKSEWESNK